MVNQKVIKIHTNGKSKGNKKYIQMVNQKVIKIHTNGKSKGNKKYRNGVGVSNQMVFLQDIHYKLLYILIFSIKHVPTEGKIMKCKRLLATF